MGQSRPFSEIADLLMGDEVNYTARIAELDDAQLVYFHRVLSNTDIVIDAIWLPRLEREMHRRGLINFS